MQEFRELARRARELLPDDIPIVPGANYGTTTAQIEGRLADTDFLWLAPFDVFVRAEALAALREKADGQEFADAVKELGLTGLHFEPFPSRPADPT